MFSLSKSRLDSLVLIVLTLAHAPMAVADEVERGKARQPRNELRAPVEATTQPQLMFQGFAERLFHVDDFAGLAPDYAPLQATKSLWCGRRPDPAQCYLGTGYPSNSVQIFESRQLPVTHWDVYLDFEAVWSVETSYDHIYVDAKSNTHDWETTQLPFDGSGLQRIYTSATPGGWAKFRFRVVSDDIYDAEDGGWQAPGSAIVIDAVQVWDGNLNVADYQSFELEAVGATTTADGDWSVDDVYVVTSTADSGLGTLRDAITTTNASSSLNRIVFDIPGAGPHSIQPLSALPAVTDYFYIDGFTQPGASANTNPLGSPCNAAMKIELYGFMAGSPANGLLFQAPGKVRGLVLNQWGQNAIKIESNNVFVEGNFIGPNIDGVTSGDFNHWGINITGGACRVGGCSPAARNVISGNAYGVVIDGNSAGNGVHGNYIGIGADASTPLGNTYGVRINGTAHNNYVGSPSTLVDLLRVNQFANNYSFGIIVDGTDPWGNRFYGNSFHEDFRAIEIGNGVTPDPSNVNVYSAEGSVFHGHIAGPPNSAGQIHFYRSEECGGPWGTGYAETYIGRMSKNSGPSGLEFFDFTIPGPLPPGCWITATVTFNTPANLNTSELSVCRQYQNTPSGGSAVVDLLDENLNVRGTATYAEVASPGNTVLTNPFEPAEWLEAPFEVPDVKDPSIYYDVTTDASYNGSVEVCLHYDENALPGPEEKVVLVHFDGTQWQDVTSARDTDNNTICGKVESLSPFAIAMRMTPTGAGDDPLPTVFALHANVPNPFNPITTIRYDVPAGGSDVSLTIYDVAGRRVRTLVDEHRPAGVFSVQWNGTDDRGQRVASGVYFYRMRAGEFVETRKMVLLK